MCLLFLFKKNICWYVLCTAISLNCTAQMNRLHINGAAKRKIHKKSLHQKFKRCAFMMYIVWHFIWKQIICYINDETSERKKTNDKPVQCILNLRYLWNERKKRRMKQRTSETKVRRTQKRFNNNNSNNTPSPSTSKCYQRAKITAEISKYWNALLLMPLLTDTLRVSPSY